MQSCVSTDVTTPTATTTAADGISSNMRELTLAQRLALGTRLTELREQKNLTQLQVARDALGYTVSHAAVSRLERGVFGAVDNDRLDKLASFYDTTVAALLVEMEGRADGDALEEYSPSESLVVQAGVESRLFNLRQAMALTKSEMATLLGHTSSVTWVMWEKGQVTPRPDTLLEIAVACNISAAWLILGKRAKPQAPVFSMRLRAMQKMYGLDNRELSLLAGMDVEHGRGTIARMSRARRPPTYEIAHAVAQALDVPVSWICPPQEGYLAPSKESQPQAISAVPPRKTAGDRFVDELKELFDSGVLQESEIQTMRSRFMKEIVGKLRTPA